MPSPPRQWSGGGRGREMLDHNIQMPMRITSRAARSAFARPVLARDIGNGVVPCLHCPMTAACCAVANVPRPVLVGRGGVRPREKVVRQAGNGYELLTAMPQQRRALT